MNRMLQITLTLTALAMLVAGCGPKSPQVITLAGSDRGCAEGSGAGAQFDGPLDVAVDAEGYIYVADTNNHRIRMLSVDGTVSTIAGKMDAGYAAGYTDGPASEARFQTPYGVAVDEAGNVYVADTGNHCIRVIAPDGAASLTVTTLAGAKEPGYMDGPGSEARFNFPRGIAIDAKGNLYVADMANHRIRKITPEGAASLTVTTLAGSGEPGNADGPAGEAQFRIPEGVAVDPDGNVVVADTGNHRIRKIVLKP